MSTTGKPPRFSIIVPCYNREQAIRATIDSCLAQRQGDFELIIIDDGSSDSSVAVAQSYADARIVVREQANAGPAAARNHGMRIARGDYLAFLDSDDAWYPGFLEAVDKALVDNPERLVYGPIIVDRGVGRYWVKPDRAIATGESIYDYLYVHGAFIQTSTMVIPKALGASVQWDEAITFGDNDQFAIDCWHTGIEFHMLDKPWTLYDDVLSDDALSQLPLTAGRSPRHLNFLDWMHGQHEHMSDAAWAGFRSHFESVGLARENPKAALELILAARREGVLSAKGVLRQSLQSFAPRFYRKLVDRFVALRGRPLESIEPEPRSTIRTPPGVFR
ncbi:MAG: hypothetical protein CSB44_09695 [Gammaproteobacteria bacterium]|nr:MAG: hypothetical protein CSB44_09695 [Gammaproteobacteria bacterium]